MANEYMKILNIINYQGGANQNFNNISLHTCQITSVGKVTEKSEPLYTVDGDAKWYSSYGKQYRDSSKS